MQLNWSEPYASTGFKTWRRQARCLSLLLTMLAVGSGALRADTPFYLLSGGTLGVVGDTKVWSNSGSELVTAYISPLLSDRVSEVIDGKNYAVKERLTSLRTVEEGFTDTLAFLVSDFTRGVAGQRHGSIPCTSAACPSERPSSFSSRLS